MRMVMNMLSTALAKFPHLLRNSGDLMSKCRNVVLTPHCRFVKFYIKDFYMSDTHDALVANSSLSADVAERDDYRCMAPAVLRSQL